MNHLWQWSRQGHHWLVRLSGQQMKRARPVIFPALLDGLFTLFTMLETLEHYSLSDLQAFANIAKISSIYNVLATCVDTYGLRERGAKGTPFDRRFNF